MARLKVHQGYMPGMYSFYFIMFFFSFLTTLPYHRWSPKKIWRFLWRFTASVLQRLLMASSTMRISTVCTGMLFTFLKLAFVFIYTTPIIGNQAPVQFESSRQRVFWQVWSGCVSFWRSNDTFYDIRDGISENRGVWSSSQMALCRTLSGDAGGGGKNHSNIWSIDAPITARDSFRLLKIGRRLWRRRYTCFILFLLKLPCQPWYPQYFFAWQSSSCCW